MPSCRLASRCKRAVVTALLLVTASHGSAALAAPPKGRGPARPPAAPPTIAAPPVVEKPVEPWDVEFRQIMMAPAITGNLRAVAIDPSDEKNIYVATQHGTLVHSNDGGVTWAETNMSPFLARSPTTEFIFAGDPGYKAVDLFQGMKVQKGEEEIHWDPLNRPNAEVGIPVTSPEFGTNHVNLLRYSESYPSATSSLFESIAGRDPLPYDEIQAMTICPGGAHSIFVVTNTKLLGSADGTRFVELYTGRESSPLFHVACSPVDPNEVVFTSGDGTFRSTDGGLTFETIGQVFATAVAFGPAAPDGSPLLSLVAGAELWIGFASDPDSMQPIPIGGEMHMISSVATTPDSVWIATENGVRVSRDGGNSWMFVEDLEGFSWDRISVASNPHGPEHILVLNEDGSWLSTDGGVSFAPSFREESRRHLRWPVSYPTTTEDSEPGFLVLTSGELWTTRVRGKAEDPRLAEVRSMAARRLKQMPTVNDLTDLAMAKANLTRAQIDSINERWKSRAWLPGALMNVQAGRVNSLERRSATISRPEEETVLEPKVYFEASLQLTWELPDVFSPPPEIVYKRMDLYEVRKRLSFFIEDAYLERRQVLEQLAGGGIDEEQSLTLQARLEVLDVVLEEFTTSRGKR